MTLSISRRTFVLTTLFVLLWSSGGIASAIALREGSAFALLLTRYGIAALALGCVAVRRGYLLPRGGEVFRVTVTGLILAGLYAPCYLLALEHGLRPGLLATLLGVQPLLTLAVTERRFDPWRLAGLLCALGGVALIVRDGMTGNHLTAGGFLFALLALAGITTGTILQKAERRAPIEIMPLQYVAGFLVIALLSPLEPLRFAMTPGFLLGAAWLGLAISIGATLALYGLIASGNLVNVTSSMYLVPPVTAAMDWILLGHPMTLADFAGLGAILGGLVLTFARK